MEQSGTPQAPLGHGTLHAPCNSNRRRQPPAESGFGSIGSGGAKQRDDRLVCLLIRF
jgi:hypothetical protein